MSTSAPARLDNQWDDAKALGMTEAEKLLYRSNLLGSDKRITNYGGGNTSAKVMERDPLTGAMVEVLWVKGSGGDVGSIKMDGFATLYMDKLRALKGVYRGLAHEDEMVGLLPHCTFNLNPRAASIDTPLHAYVPRKHVDHMHPDAIIAIAAAKNSRALTAEIFGDDIGWLPWKRPGYELGLRLEKYCHDHPQAKGVVLESHGLFTWDDDAKACYTLTLEIIQKAMDWFGAKTAGRPVFGGPAHVSLPPADRKAVAARLMPAIRGMVSGHQHMVGHFDDSDAVWEWHPWQRLARLARTISCARKFARWWWISIPQRTMLMPFSRGCLRRWRPTVTITLPIMPAANMTIPPRSGIPMPWFI
jgi:rhamnose utilization protein RhaD (predicted bifunctional aldolase and dehydrogenase)